ncbi:MAG: hypothetical protein II765_03475 [Lachnospiraceae bacterium]|nr:hypothetical protein [Lachnospiraceae bacterium]
MNYKEVFTNSIIRNNCISWLDFKGDDRVLLLGQGTRAYEKYLSRLVSAVDYEADGSYDWVIAYDQNLELILPEAKSLLNPSGRLVLLQTNPLGVSFLNGLVSDQEEEFFATINNASDNLNGNYYSLRQITELLGQYGFDKYKTYYPYPNKDFPYQIYSDDRLPQLGELHIQEYPYKSYRMELFREQNLYDRLIEAGRFIDFANSYMIIVSDDLPGLIYSKYSNERNAGMNIITNIYSENGEKYVVKKASDSDSVDHIRSIYDKYNRLQEHFTGSNFLANKCQMLEGCEDALSFEFIDGTNLDVIMDERLAAGDKEGFLALIDEYLKNVRMAYPDPVTRDLDVDLIFQNIIVVEGKWNVIDYEWTMADEWPVDFLIYRAIHYFYYQSQNCRKLFADINELYNYCGLDSDKISDYDQTEADYQSRVGSSENALSQQIDIDGDIRMADLCMYVQAEYYAGDVQKGVTNITVPIVRGLARFDLSVPDGVDKLRILSANRNVQVKIKNDHGLDIVNAGVLMMDHIYSYVDRQLIFDLVNADGHKLEPDVEIQIELVSQDACEFRTINDLYHTCQVAEQDRDKWHQLADERMDVIDDLTAQLKKIYESKAWKLASKLIK